MPTNTGPKYRNLIPQHKFQPHESFEDLRTTEMIRHLIGAVFKLSGANEHVAKVWASLIIQRGIKFTNSADLENPLREFINSIGITPAIDEGLEGRAAQIFAQIKPHITDEHKTVLDIGTGDGMVGAHVSDKLQKNVTLADVIDYNQSDLPLQLYDGTKLPQADNSHDASLLLTVLHHCDEPEKVLDEAIRTTRKRIIILESIYTSEEDRRLQTFLDWFYNRILHDGVNCPFNFNSPEGWNEVFKQKGLTIAYQEDLGRDQPLVPEHHWLYVLDK